MLQAVAFLPQQAWDAKATFARWTMVVNKALLCHLRANSSLRAEVAHVVGKAEMQLLLAGDHAVITALQARFIRVQLQSVRRSRCNMRVSRHQCACSDPVCNGVHVRTQVLSELVEAADVVDGQRWQMHQAITAMNDVLGGCERIFRTPIPIAYTRHTTRFLIVWLTVLPYALWAKFFWTTLFVAPIIGVLLLGINEIGIDVEEPFSLLPLEAFVERCCRDCKQLVEMQVSANVQQCSLPCARLRRSHENLTYCRTCAFTTLFGVTSARIHLRTRKRHNTSSAMLARTS